MNCHQLRHDIELLALGALPAEHEARVRDHVAGCSRCQAVASECIEIAAAIQSSPRASVPTAVFGRALREAVAVEIAGQRRWRRIRRRIRQGAVAVGALAAMGLLALGIRLAAGLDEGNADGVVSSPKGPATVQTDLAERWRYAGARSAPASMADKFVVQGATMYVLAGDEPVGCVVAVDVKAGRPRWRSKVTSYGYLAAGDGYVFCLGQAASGEPELLALAAETGKAVWRYPAGTRPGLAGPCCPTLLPGKRVCWTVGGEVHMLDAETGDVLWRRAFPAGQQPSQVVADGRDLYVATADGLHRLNAPTGATVWQIQYDHARGVGRPMLVIGGGRLYLALGRLGQRSRLCCVDLAGRKTLWSKRIVAASSLVATDDAVYLRSQRIKALDGLTGELLWTHAATGCGPLSVVDGMLHFVDTRHSGRLVALERRTGQLTQAIPGVLSCDAFARDGDTGLIKTQDGIVRAIALSRIDRI